MQGSQQIFGKFRKTSEKGLILTKFLTPKSGGLRAQVHVKWHMFCQRGYTIYINNLPPGCSQSKL